MSASVMVIDAWWHWAVRNGPAILFALSLVSAITFGVVAICLVSLMRRLGRHLRLEEKRAVLIARLETSVQEQALTLEALNGRIRQAEGHWENLGAAAVPQDEKQAALFDRLATALTEQARRMDILSERMAKTDSGIGANGTGPPALSPALRDEILSLAHDMAADDHAKAAAPAQADPEANS